MTIAITCALLVLLAIIAIADIKTGLIPNVIVYPGILALLALAGLWPAFGPSLINASLAGLSACGVFLLIAMVYPAGMGGGDVKLAGMVGLMLGFPYAMMAFGIAGLAGGVGAIILLIYPSRIRPATLPYGPFLASGGAVSLIARTFL